MGLVLAIYGNNVNIGEALFISGFAMLVVFLVLLVISYLIDVTAFFTNVKNRVNKTDKTEIINTEVTARIEGTKSNDQLIATIAGAIAVYLGTSVDNIKIKSIRRINQSDSPWTKRGLFNQINKK